MAKFRMVHTEFWNDPTVVEEMTPEDKFFFLYLLTNPNTTQIGIYEITRKQIAFDMGYSMETINSLLDRFLKHHDLVKYNTKTREIAIKNWGKYNLVRGGKPMLDCIMSELAMVKDIDLIEYVSQGIENKDIKSIFKTYYDTSHDTSTISGQEKEEEEEEYKEEDKEEDKKSSCIITKEKIQTVIDSWNKLGLQQLKAINSNTKRHKMLKTRIKEYSFEEIITAIESIEKSPFLMGHKSDWKITFDWFIRPNNFLKVLEGNYIDGGVKNGKHSRSNGEEHDQYDNPDIGFTL